MVGSRTYSLATLCKAAGRSIVHVQALQKAFGLPARADDRYSAGYISFIKRAVALRTANVAQERLTDLLELEKKILKLLNVHPLNNSPIWFFDGNCEPSGRTLLLTGFDVEFALNGSIQPGLDFGSGENEMFKSHEMGENLQQILEKYVDLRNKVLVKAAEEVPLVRDALKLAAKLVRSGGFE